MMPERDAGDTRTMSVRFPAALHERLRRAAFNRREPMSAIIIAGTERELDRRESEGRRHE